MRPGYLSPTNTDDRQIILRCRWLGALSPDTACPKEELCLYQTSAWDMLVQKGWLRETPRGDFYLNERILPRTLEERFPYRVLAVRLALLALGSALFAWFFR